MTATFSPPVRRPHWADVAIGMVPAAILLWLVLRATGGVFTYTLDDPYIHLGLARSILHGHYGLNPGELSAPSSSILWPFLLAPFALLPAAVFEWVPLALNLLFLAASLALLIRFLPETLPRWAAVGAAVVLAFLLNLYGLVFTGMEHSLQILLVLVALEGFFARPLDGSPRPWRFYAALILLPLVRYEGLALAAALLGYQFWRGDRKASVLCGAAILGMVAAFSLALWAAGLGFMPSSILAKTADPLVLHFFRAVFDNLPLLAGCLGLILVVRWYDGLLAIALAAMTLLHLAVGQFGWFGRYEVYWLATLVVIALRLPEMRRRWPLALVVGWLFLTSSAYLSTPMTPTAARAVFGQQRQMDRIVQLLDRPVAVNDIGLVTLHARHYVLDLYGLASVDALKAPHRTPQDASWAGPLAARHGVRHVMIYEGWFGRLPANWIRVGDLVLTVPRGVLGSDRVALFATDPEAAEDFRVALRRYGACCAVVSNRVELR